jgi:UDP-N-acetylmuramoyl-tripeptide--D-alanyl-D-alanine ligase
MIEQPALWKAAEVRQATGGKGEGEWVAYSVSIDSRTLNRDDLFVAICGPRFDGHDFVPAAIRSGAAAAVISRDVADCDGPVVRVSDTLRALEDLGRAARARSAAKIIAVTGSVGKTGSKEALKHMLSAQMPCHASEASLNNQWGVPLSLSRLSPRMQAAIFEIGMNHAGEIAPLVKLVRPHIALITTVEPVHLEFFDSVEAIAEAKAEIFLGLEPGGTAILNADNPHFTLLKRRALTAGAARIVSFGQAQRADTRLLSFDATQARGIVRADICGQKITYQIGIPGRHIALNSLAWLACVKAIGADLEKAAASLRDLQPTPGRGTRSEINLENGMAHLIDESYNANPASMRAALQTLGAVKPAGLGRRIAVLGDMLELGAEGPALHAALATVIAEARVDKVFLTGQLMDALATVLPEQLLVAHTQSAAALAPLVAKNLQPDDVVMVKGSYGSRMRDVVSRLIGGPSACSVQ